MFLSPVGKKGFENTTVFLFARREVRAGAVAEAAGVIFFQQERGKRSQRKASHLLSEYLYPSQNDRRRIRDQKGRRHGNTDAVDHPLVSGTHQRSAQHGRGQFLGGRQADHA